MVASNFEFSTNLEAGAAFELLHTGTGALLAQLGQELKILYETEQLFTRLGGFSPPIIKNHTKRQDNDLAVPPLCDWATESQEKCYIHFLRLIAYAIDDNFQKLVQKCVQDFVVDAKPFHHGGIKAIKVAPLPSPQLTLSLISYEPHSSEGLRSHVQQAPCRPPL